MSSLGTSNKSEAFSSAASTLKSALVACVLCNVYFMFPVRSREAIAVQDSARSERHHRRERHRRGPRDCDVTRARATQTLPTQ